jgi:hypothetical protein
MMTTDQTKIVKMVYNRFIESEEEIWTDLDSNLEMFGYLTDKELIVEADVKHEKHCQTGIRCAQDHQPSNCMAPIILESVEIILDLYDKTGELHEKNRYILEYYLVMSELKMIFPIGLETK